MENLKRAEVLVSNARHKRNRAGQKLEQRKRIFENMELMHGEPNKLQLKNANSWTFADVVMLRYLPYSDTFWSNKKTEESENWAIVKKQLDAFRSLDPLYLKLYIMRDVMHGYSDDQSPKYPRDNYADTQDNAKNLLEKLWQDFSERRMTQETYDAIMADKYAKDILDPNYESCALIMKLYKKGKTPNGPGQNWVGWGRRVV